MVRIGRKLIEVASVFFSGLINAVAVKEAAAVEAEVIDAEEQLLEKTLNAYRKVKPLAESGDDFEKKLAATFTNGLRETAQLRREMLTRAMTPAERTEAISHFLPDSGDGSMSSPPGTHQALEGPETNGATQEPPRRGPGRPRGSRNKPKPTNPNGTNQ